MVFYFKFSTLAAILFRRAKLLHAILVEGIIGNISVKIFQISAVGSGDF